MTTSTQNIGKNQCYAKKEKKMTLYEIVEKLNGNVLPYGSSDIDSIRLKNLRNLIELVNALIDDILAVNSFQDRNEGSILELANLANEWLTYTREHLNEVEE